MPNERLGAPGRQLGKQSLGHGQLAVVLHHQRQHLARISRVERGEAGPTMLKLAEQVTLDGLDKQSSRRADFFADVGRGLAREPRTRGEAVRWLRRAEEAAPQRIRNSAPARETVAYLLNRARAAAGGPELRGMAARMGLPH